MEYYGILNPRSTISVGGMLWTTCDASDSGRTRLEGTLHNTLLRACAVKEVADVNIIEVTEVLTVVLRVVVAPE